MEEDNGFLILVDALLAEGHSLEVAVGTAGPLTEEEDQLDMAEWLLNHPGVSLDEITAEMHRLLELRMGWD